MRSGLFKQYFTIFLITLLSCTGLLGLTLLAFSGANYTAQRQELLESAANRVSSALTGEYGALVLQENRMEQILHSIEQLTGVSVYIADGEGEILACSEEHCHHGDRLSRKVLSVLERGSDYFGANYLSGFFLGRGDFLFAERLQDAAGAFRGFVLASVPVGPLFSHLGDTLFTYLFSASVMLLVAFVVIYTATLRLTMPLQEMSRAASSFAKGDFSARVQVEGEDEIAGLAKNFNRMAEALDELEQNRRSFVANVSHDLRTPMTTIGGYIDGILDGTIPPDKQEQYLRVVSEETKRLSRLTSSLLSVMQLEEQRTDAVQLVSVNAWELVLNIMFNMEQRIEQKRIHVPDFETDEVYVRADKDMLHQVVYNLLDNAVKYTPEGGELRVGITGEGEQVRISVRNTGKGIAPQEQASVFERFYKTDKSRSIDKKGTGLGLYIVKMLVSGMDGSVVCNSDGSSYTEFVVTLGSAPAPVDLVERERRQQAESRQQSAGRWGWLCLPWQKQAPGGKNGEES